VTEKLGGSQIAIALHVPNLFWSAGASDMTFPRSLAEATIKRQN
jgi:hypothetical protein